MTKDGFRLIIAISLLSFKTYTLFHCTADHFLYIQGKFRRDNQKVN